MAQPETENPSHEIKEPALKVPKVHRNGAADPDDKVPAPFIKVLRLSEKAILPSRASPLSAGYDLSRCFVPESRYPLFCFFMLCDSDWALSFPLVQFFFPVLLKPKYLLEEKL